VSRSHLESVCIASREGEQAGRRSDGHVFDLRRAINTLDLSLTGGFSQTSETLPSGPPNLLAEPMPRLGPGSGSAEEILGQLRKDVFEADMASFLDSELGRNELDRPAVSSHFLLAKRGADCACRQSRSRAWDPPTTTR